MDLLESFAKTLTGDPSVSVVMKGKGCFVDLQTKQINIPAISVPNGTKIPPYIIGYLDHEVGHLKFSTVAAERLVRDAFKSATPYERAVADYVHNVLDDCRQEPLFIQRYPGGRYYLGIAAVFDIENTITRESAEGVASNKALTDPRVLASIGYLQGFARAYYETGHPMPESVTREALSLAGKWFPEYKKLPLMSPMKVAELTIEFVKANPYTPPPQPAGQPKRQEGGEGSGEESGPGGPPVPGEGKAQGKAEGKGAGDEAEGSGGGGVGGSMADLSDESGIEFLSGLGHAGKKAEFDKQVAEIQKPNVLTADRGSKAVYPPRTTEWDKVFNFTAAVSKVLASAPDVLKQVVASTVKFDQTTSNVLGPVQRKFLGAHKSRKTVRDFDGYEFSDDAFVSVASKNFRGLYHDRDNKKTIKGTAVTLLLDVSGSMTSAGSATLFGESSNAATASIWSVWAMASILRCPFEILAYSTGDTPEDVRLVAGKESVGWVPFRRTESVITHVIKTFDEKWGQQHKNALVALLGGGGSDHSPKLSVPSTRNLLVGTARQIWRGNCDGDNFLVARERMMRRPEERKVIIVVSDGQPVGACVPDEHPKSFLRYEIDRAIKAGIKVVGIGLGREGGYVKRFYPVYRHLMNPAGLGKALMETL